MRVPIKLHRLSFIVKRNFFTLPDFSTQSPKVTRITQTRILPYNPSQVFKVIADINEYKNFVPYMIDSHIYGPGRIEFDNLKEGDKFQMKADLEIGAVGMSIRYTSLVKCQYPYYVEAQSVDSTVFTQLLNKWTIQQHGERHSQVQFLVEYEFTNELHRVTEFVMSTVADELIVNCHGHAHKLIANNMSESDGSIVLLLNYKHSHPDSLTSTNSLRSSLYLAGGLISISARSIIVDLLTNTLDPLRISHVIVFNAHKVTANSKEAFILRIFREKNKTSPITAFSDSPEQFTHGIRKLERTLKLLYIRKVTLLPRFHADISSVLDSPKTPIIVTELKTSLSSFMAQIQSSILDCISTTLSQLLKSNSFLDPEEYTLESVLLNNFSAQNVKNSKSLLYEIRELRKILDYLVSYDAVQFYQYLETVLSESSASASSVFRSADYMPNQWLYLDAAQPLFEFAKKRVYQIKSPDGDESDVTAIDDAWRDVIPQNIQPNLEELPKWKVLVDTLREIEAERKSLIEQNASCSCVLVMVNGDRTCIQLREIISDLDLAVVKPEDDDPEIQSLPTETEITPPAPKRRRQRGGANVSSRILNPASSISLPVKRQYSTPGTKQLLKRLLINYFKWKKRLSKVTKNLYVKKTGVSEVSNRGRSRGVQAAGQRRRTRGSNMSATKSTHTSEQTTNDASDEELDAMSDLDQEESDSEFTLDPTNFGILAPSSSVYIRPYSKTSYYSKFGGDDNDDAVLEELKPQWIIMYNPDLAFVRRVEMWNLRDINTPIKLYFMVYNESIEEQIYLSGIRKEKEAFERLINEKSNMVIPVDADGKQEVSADDEFWNSLETRIAGGQRQENSNKVIIDYREFRSALPSQLHSQNLQLLPHTLTVGDYVLSPKVCIERKSLPDLISSFSSGRLYAQCEAMCLYYDIPVLLIEFDEEGSGMGGGYGMNGKAGTSGINGKNELDLNAKIVLLLLNLKKMKIIWSVGSTATAEIFKDLKRNQEEPNVQEAIEKGVEDTDLIDSMYNVTPQEMLRAIPGITSKNYQYVMTKFNTIREIADAELEVLIPVLGDENARKVYEFFRKDGRV
ncbi:hypothetical protein HK098_000444 [Nowakowskiella sp. JEL0407]|nr:hypothetical protein HK098_000444 [Nowakowskiella sp. JEL0407]